MTSPIKKSYERDAARVNLRKMLDGKKRGDRVTAAEVFEATGFPLESMRNAVRAWAEEQGFVLVAVPRDGYRVGGPTDHVDYGEKKRQQMRSKLRDGVRALVTAPVEEFDKLTERRHDFLLKRMSLLMASADQHDKEVRREFKLGQERVPLRIAEPTESDTVK